MENKKLTTCKACGAQIAKGGKVTCQQCGKVNKKPVYKRGWFILLSILVVLGVIGNLGGGNETKTNNQTNTVPAETPAVVEKKPDPLVITSDKLVDDLKENALNASDTYKDKYVEVTGVLSNIDASGDYFNLRPINDEYSFTTIMCYIEDEHLEQVKAFKSKQKVTLIGTISDVGEVLGYSIKVETIK